MNKPKRHHTLPESYLLQFGKDAGVWVYDRTNNAVRWQQAKDTSVRAYFYAYENADGTRNFTPESMLSQIEGPLPEICEKLRRKENLTPQEQADLCMFAGFMMTRTPDFRDGIERMEGELIQKVTRMMFRSVDDASRAIEDWTRANPDGDTISLTPQELFDFSSKGEFSVKIHKNRSLQVMFELAPSFAETLSKLNIGVLHAAGNSAFVTCDRPLTIVPPKIRDHLPKWGGVGLLTPGANKYLPLASDLTIVFGDPGENFVHLPLKRQGVLGVNAAVGAMTDRFLIGRDEYLIKRWAERLRLAEISAVQTMTIN